MKKKSIYYTWLCLSLAALFAASCSDEAGEAPSMESPAAAFHIMTRAGVDDATQLTRLYMGERKPEHASEALHCNRIVDIEGGTVTLDDLKPQWYKFVFLCVPDVAGTGDGIFTEETPGNGSCDMNKLMIDYTPVLRQAPGTEKPVHETPDGDIFRKVINRWVKSGETVREDVVLNRLNGQLVIDMGILEDQFDRQVTGITLQVENTPTRLYITDNDVDEIKTADPGTFTWTTVPEPNMPAEGEDPQDSHVITVNLLPGALTGSITVRTRDGGEFDYPLQGTYTENLTIRPNIRTVLEFNGVQNNHFTIRYAGYKDTGIDVDTDDWDGWQDLGFNND